MGARVAPDALSRETWNSGTSGTMKLLSWNVNGIRAAIKKGFLESVASIDPDVLCLQETRALPEQVDLELPGYTTCWNPAKRRGYSGTAILTKEEPVTVRNGMGIKKLDDEGRVITAEFEDLYLVNVYTPNAGRELARLEFRTTVWDPAFLAYCKTLEGTKPVVFCGDLNVAHKEIDIHDPKANEGLAGFTQQERASFDRIVESGFIDTFRHFCAEGARYTWWSYIGRARQHNRGWRIDYFCVSQSLKGRLRSAEILPQVTGSDHCPVTLELG